MTRSGRIRRIAAISRSAERVAAQTLSTSQSQLDKYYEQFNELLAYREEYRASLRSGSASPMSGSEVQKLRAFVAQIDKVIDGLQAKIRQASGRHEVEREAWLQQLVDRMRSMVWRVVRSKKNNTPRKNERSAKSKIARD
jgi:flagellar export protein FliJ